MDYPTDKIQSIEAMKKEVTTGQLLAIAVTLLIAVFSAWMTMNNKVSKMEERIAAQEKQYDKIEQKIDRTNELVTKVLIELQNKKDRD